MANFNWDEYTQQSGNKDAFEWDNYTQASEPDKDQSLSDSLMQAALNAPGEALGALVSLPGQAIDTGASIWEHPLTGSARALGKVGSGFAQGLKGLWNLPLVGTKFLSRHHVPGFSEGFPFADSPQNLGDIAEKLQVGDTGLDKKIFGKQKEGDALPESIGQIIPFFLGGGEAKLGELLMRGGLAAASQEQNPLTGALLTVAPKAAAKTVKRVVDKTTAPSRLRKIDAQVDDLQKAYNLSDEQLKVFKEALHQQYGKDTPAAFKRDIQLASDKMDKLKDALAIPKEDLSNRLPGATGERAIQEAQRDTGNVKKEIQEYLGKGLEHAEHFAQIADEERTQIEKSAGKEYDEIEDKLKNENVEVPRTYDFRGIENSIRSSLGAGLKEAEIEKYVQRMMKSLAPEHGTETIGADKLLRNYRELRDLSNEAYSAIGRAKDAGEKGRLRDLAEKYKEDATKLNTILKNHMGKDAYENLQNLNSRYAKIASFKRHPLRKQLRQGVVSKDILNQMRGKTPGIVDFREQVMQNPKLLRHALGQRFAAKPESLLEAEELPNKYIDRLPALQGMKERLADAIKQEAMAKSKAQYLQAEKARVQEAYDLDTAEQSLRENAQKQHAQLSSELMEKTKALEELERKISHKEGSKSELEDMQRRANVLKNDIIDSKSRLMQASQLLLKLLGVKYGLTKLLK